MPTRLQGEASVVLIAASACSGTPPTSPAGVPAGPVVSALRVFGVPPELSPGASTQLTASPARDVTPEVRFLTSAC